MPPRNARNSAEEIINAGVTGKRRPSKIQTEVRLGMPMSWQKNSIIDLLDPAESLPKQAHMPLCLFIFFF